MSVSLSYGFSPRLEQENRIACFSLAILGNVFFSSLFPGSRSVSIFVVDPGRCTSITEPPTKSEHRRTVCWGLNWPMSMGLQKIGSERFPYSTGRHPKFEY